MFYTDEDGERDTTSAYDAALRLAADILRRNVPCGACHGDGFCHGCNGNGRVLLLAGYLAACGDCIGDGACTACNGDGWIAPA